MDDELVAPCPGCAKAGEASIAPTTAALCAGLCVCGWQGPMRNTEAEAVAAWNTRAPATNEEMRQTLELSEVLVGIREQTSKIVMHRCSEKCKSDFSCDDPGVPPCRWASIEKEEYCENCKVAEEAREIRRKLRIRKNVLVRKIAARAALASGQDGGKDGKS